MGLAKKVILGGIMLATLAGCPEASKVPEYGMPDYSGHYLKMDGAVGRHRGRLKKLREGYDKQLDAYNAETDARLRQAKRLDREAAILRGEEVPEEEKPEETSTEVDPELDDILEDLDLDNDTDEEEKAPVIIK